MENIFSDKKMQAFQEKQNNFFANNSIDQQKINK